MRATIGWIQRDLRLGDNQALVTAMERAESMILIFILDPRRLY
jgi:deoxyribodipyrimidine photolyase